MAKKKGFILFLTLFLVLLAISIGTYMAYAYEKKHDLLTSHVDYIENSSDTVVSVTPGWKMYTK